MEFVLVLLVIAVVALYVKLSDLSKAVARLQGRLDQLEREPASAKQPRRGLGEAPAEPVDRIATEPGPRPVPPQPAAPIRHVDIYAQPPAPPVTPLTPVPPVRAEPPAPPAPPPPPPPPTEKVSPPRDWESLLGANWLSKLGIAALAVAAAFFLKYAVDSGWLGPTARVAIGLGASVILLGLGQWLLTKPIYRAYAQVLSSGGIIIFFLSIYAAYNFYHLLGWALAFGLLALGAVAASALAAANDTQAVAMLCLAGAFLTPLLIHEEGVGPGLMTRLYGYLALLNVWGAILSQWRRWYSLTALAFGATWIIFLSAGIKHGPDYLLVEGFAVVFLLFAMYGGRMTMRGGEEPSPESERVGIAVILGGCLAFAVASGWILWEARLLGLPGLVSAGALLALLLAGLAVALPGLSKENEPARSLLRYLAAVALALLMSIALLSAPPTPRAQVPLAFVFALVNYLLFLAVAVHMQRREEGRHAALALLVANAFVHVIAVFRVLAEVRVWGYEAAPLWFPIAGAITVAALWATGKDERRDFRKGVLITAQLLPFVSLAALLSPTHLGAAWRGIALYGSEFLLVSIVSLAARRLTTFPDWRGDLLAAVGNAFVFFGLLSASARLTSYQGFVLLCGCAILLAFYHAVVGAFVLRREDDRPLRQLSYLGLALTFATIAIPLQLRASALTVAWAAESAVLVYTGLRVRDRRISWYGLVLLFLTAAKSLLMDLPITPAPFVFLLNRRLLSGAAVIAAAFISANLLSRRQEEAPEQERSLPTMLVLLGTFFALCFVSADLWRYAEILASSAGAISACNFALAAYWSLLAAVVLAAGVRYANLPLRVFALILLLLVLAKVFFVDLMMPPVPYRFLVNTRFLAGLAAIAAAALGAWMLSRQREGLTPTEAGLPATLAVLANLLALLFLSLDLWQYVGVKLPLATRASGQQLYLSIFWSLYALGAVCVGFWRRSRPVRLFSMGLLYLAIFKVFLFDLGFLQQLHRIISFFGLGIILLVVSLLYTRFERQLK